MHTMLFPKFYSFGTNHLTISCDVLRDSLLMVEVDSDRLLFTLETEPSPNAAFDAGASLATMQQFLKESGLQTHRLDDSGSFVTQTLLDKLLWFTDSTWAVGNRRLPATPARTAALMALISPAETQAVAVPAATERAPAYSIGVYDWEVHSHWEEKETTSYKEADKKAGRKLIRKLEEEGYIGRELGQYYYLLSPDFAKRVVALKEDGSYKLRLYTDATHFLALKTITSNTVAEDLSKLITNQFGTPYIGGMRLDTVKCILRKCSKGEEIYGDHYHFRKRFTLTDEEFKKAGFEIVSNLKDCFDLIVRTPFMQHCQDLYIKENGMECSIAGETMTVGWDNAEEAAQVMCKLFAPSAI
jgi:hypothetical protein